MARDSFLDRLPLPVLQDIVSRVDLSSFFAAATTCTALKAAVDLELPFLQALHLEDFCPSSAALKRLVASGVGSSTSGLSLRLHGASLDGDFMEAVAKCKLDELHLGSCREFSPDFFHRIALACPNLRRLSINPCPCSTTMFIGSLFDCHSLESLSLLFDPEFLILRQIVLPPLRVLEVGILTEDYGIQFVQDAASHCMLRRLSLALDHMSDSIIHLIADNLPLLEELELRDEEEVHASDLTNSGIQKLGNLARLRRLSLIRSARSFHRVNDVGIFIMIQSLQQLESIRLGGFSRITDASCAAILSGCPDLHTFELVRTAQLTDLAFHNLTSSAPMRFVNFNLSQNSLITGDALARLICCGNLEVLNLRGCRSVGDAGLQEISKLLNLKTLLLDGSDVSDFGLYPLARGRMPLSILSLRACTRITDDGIVALMAGQVAQTLESLDLSVIPKLTDASILSLAKNRVQPAELWLRNCYLLGDVSVMALATHSRGRVLKLLDLWNCKKITADALRWFKPPYFSGLRKLGVPQPLEESIASARPYTRLSFNGFECFDSADDWVDEFERRLKHTAREY